MLDALLPPSAIFVNVLAGLGKPVPFFAGGLVSTELSLLKSGFLVVFLAEVVEGSGGATAFVVAAAAFARVVRAAVVAGVWLGAVALVRELILVG